MLRRDYETGVVAGRHPEHVTLHPLYPYQREGMLHLAFGERALLADEMGLGKTIQAVAACTLLRHLGKARRVLVVTPASLKAEWEEQTRKFTTLTQQIVFGPRSARMRYYADSSPPFFTIVNYEQVVTDTLDINNHLRPDIVVLDEAQRIKNWTTKTAQAVKRLQSRYAFVLTGTPIENRIDELYSIVDFLDPSLLGPLFRFNREFYQFDQKGRPEDYKNLPALRDRVKPVLLRRRKHHVETELPDRSDRNHFVKLTQLMQAEYDEYKKSVSELVQISLKRPLTKKQQNLLMIMLGIMRMICDSPSIIKGHDCQDCPKLVELARILEEVLVFPILASAREKRAGLLSGGQRQSLAVAMALMRRPRLLLLDEPVAGMAPEAGRDLLEAVEALRRKEGFPLVIVEHRLRQVQPHVKRAGDAGGDLRELASMTGGGAEFREKLEGLVELRRRKSSFMKMMRDAGLV